MCKGNLVTTLGRGKITVAVAVKTVQEDNAEVTEVAQRKFLEEVMCAHTTSFTPPTTTTTLSLR